MEIHHATEILPAGPQAPSQARRFVARALDAWNRSDLRERAVLAVSELVTNAFLYGEGDIALVVSLGDSLRVEVRDDGPGLPAQRHYSPTSTTGRGLHLVGHMADRWGTTHGGNGTEPGNFPRGKAVWFEIDTPVPRQASATLETPDLTVPDGEAYPATAPRNVREPRLVA